MDTAGFISCQDGGAPRPANPSSSRPVQGNMPSTEKLAKNIARRKRKGPSETHSSVDRSGRDQEQYEIMAEAVLEMVAALKSKTIATRPSDDRFTITDCIRALDEIQGIDERLYFAALDLFEDPNLRETFLSLKGNEIRLTWLQGKCGKTTYS